MEKHEKVKNIKVNISSGEWFIMSGSRDKKHQIFKIPRSDQCNICRRHEIELQNEKDPKKRRVLEENLQEHQCDPNDARDFIYNAFQESREQLGKMLSFLYASDDDDDYTPLE